MSFTDESAFDSEVGGPEPEISEVGGGLQVMEQGALNAVEKASIDIQISTAKAYPRSIERSLKQAQGLACLDAKTAEGMFYTLKRGNKKIMGPSARLAEVIASSWGNLRVDAGIESVGQTHLTAVAMAFDLETNVAIRVRVQRRITNSGGARYNDDMIGVTGNAATSIALRNAVFKVVPRVFVDRIDQMARIASTGKGTLQEKRAGAHMHFEKLGVTEAEIFAFLEVKGWDDVTLEHIIELQGAATAIKDGATSVQELFRPQQQSAGAAAMNSAAKAQPSNGSTSATSAPAPAAASAPEPEDKSPASKDQIKQLENLIPKAREAAVLDSQDEQVIADAQKAKDGPAVRQWIRDLQLRIARGQPSLGVEG